MLNGSQQPVHRIMKGSVNGINAINADYMETTQFKNCHFWHVLTYLTKGWKVLIVSVPN